MHPYAHQEIQSESLKYPAHPPLESRVCPVGLLLSSLASGPPVSPPVPLGLAPLPVLLGEVPLPLGLEVSSAGVLPLELGVASGVVGVPASPLSMSDTLLPPSPLLLLGGSGGEPGLLMGA